MSRSHPVDVDPRLLVWARETAGFTLDEVSAKLKMPADRVRRWEEGAETLSVAQLRKLSGIYKRPLAAFFLPEPPSEPAALPDFRTLPRMTGAPTSPGLRLAIREAHRLRDLMSELRHQGIADPPVPLPRVRVTASPERAGVRLRDWLDVPFEEQRGWRQPRLAFHAWRRALEDRGVLVLILSVPLNEARGFSISAPEGSCIVVSVHDSWAGRIFTLLHETAHLMLGRSGLCDIEDGRRPDPTAERTEVFCNHVAGAALVRKDLLMSMLPSRTLRRAWDDATLAELASTFAVSREVVLRRLLVHGLATRSFYETKREEWDAERRARPGKTASGGPSVARRCVSSFGVPLVAHVLEAHRRGRLSFADVVGRLGVRAKHVGRIEELVAGAS